MSENQLVPEKTAKFWHVFIRHFGTIIVILAPVIYTFGQQSERQDSQDDKIEQIQEEQKDTATKIESVQKEVQENSEVLGRLDERTQDIEEDVNNINRSLERVLERLPRPPQ